MKAKSTPIIFSCACITVLLLSMPFFSSAQTSQNLLTNSNFNSGLNAWNLMSTPVEVNIETTYGGLVNTNIVAEVDAFTSLRQKMALIPGKIYTLSYKASRRTTGSTNANVAMDVLVSGDVTGTVYVDYSKNYNNSTFGFVTETQTFTVPNNSIDKALIIEFVPRNNNSNRGVIVDDIEIIASATSSLPVQLISFTGEIRNEQTILNWKTAAEMNNKHYVVERSVNGNSYESIGTVNAGTSNGVNSYSFTDSKLKAGTNFYRLRQVDVDGAYKFSKVVIVRLQKGTDAVKVFPTLATSNINFNLSTATATNAIVSIYDTNGKMLIRTQKSLTAGANQQGVDVSNLNSGAYYFRIQNNEGTINYTQAFHKID